MLTATTSREDVDRVEPGTPARACPPVSPADDAHVLETCLTQLRGMLERLLSIAERKFAALGRADTDELRRCTVDEGGLLEQLFHTEQQRNAVIARLAQSVPDAGKGPLRLREIAANFPEPFSSSINAQMAAVHELAASLQQKNALAARVAQSLHSHIRGIFADMAQANQESVVYGPKGQHEHTCVRSWVDAVG